MTRKDYELIASVLRQNIPMQISPKFRLWKELIKDFSEKLSQENSAFNVDKFKKACGLDD